MYEVMDHLNSDPELKAIYEKEVKNLMQSIQDPSFYSHGKML